MITTKFDIFVGKFKKESNNFKGIKFKLYDFWYFN